MRLIVWPENQVCLGCENNFIQEDVIRSICEIEEYPENGSCKYYKEIIEEEEEKSMDIYTKTASIILQKPINEVTFKEREVYKSKVLTEIFGKKED